MSAVQVTSLARFSVIVLGYVLGSFLPTLYQVHQLPGNATQKTSPEHIAVEEVASAPYCCPTPPLQFYYDAGVQYASRQKALLPFKESAPDSVHYLWCGDEARAFEFRHFLSVLSAFKTTQPTKLILHHWWLPKEVQHSQPHVWLNELRLNFHNLVMHQLSAPAMPSCSDRPAVLHVAQQLLAEHGGMYVGDDVMLVRSMHELRLLNFSVVMSPMDGGSWPSIMVAQKNTVSLVVENVTFQRSEDFTHCIASGASWPADENSVLCMVIDNHTSPNTIMKGNDRFSCAARQVFYGSPEPRSPRWSPSNPIPNVGHLMLTDDNKLSMHAYLSIVSSIKCALLDKVYLHAEKEPTGELWQKVKVMPQVVVVLHQWPATTQFSQGSFYRGNMSCGSVRSQQAAGYSILYQYGGVLFDGCTTLLKPLTQRLRGYEFISPYHDPSASDPHLIDLGFMAAKRFSFFGRLLVEASHKQASTGQKGELEAHSLTYMLQVKYPQLVRPSPRLLARCTEKGCYVKLRRQDSSRKKLFNLTASSTVSKYVQAIRWLSLQDHDLESFEEPLSSKTVFSEIARYVTEQSCGHMKTKTRNSVNRHNRGRRQMKKA